MRAEAFSCGVEHALGETAQVFPLHGAGIVGYAVPTVPLFTLLGSLGMAGIEVKSIFEKGSDKERTDVGALLDLLESAADNEKLTKIINNLKNLKK